MRPLIVTVVFPLVFLLFGCITYEPVDIVIEEILQESTTWGCIGTDRKTRLRTHDGRVFIKCDIWGNVGDTLQAHVMYNHLSTPAVVFGRPR